MISNYYTLRLLAMDLDRQLKGSEIEEAFCQNKNELLISCRTQEGSGCLIVSCEPSMNYLYLRVDVHRAKKNSIDVFRILHGRIIRNISIQPADRELVIHCSGDMRLFIRMFGSKGNVLLVDQQSTVADAFLNSKELRGTVIPEAEAPRTQAVHTLDEFQNRLRAIGTILLPAAIKKLLPLFNTTLIRELCYRSRLSENMMVAELTEEDVQRLFSTCEALLREIDDSAKARIYFQNDMPRAFSIVSLEHLRGARIETFDSIHDAVRMFIGRSGKQKSLVQDKEALLHFLRQGAEKAERTLQKMEQETEVLQRAMQYETFGKLLMSNLGELKKGMREVELEDVFSRDRARVLIRLDQKLTPARNAEHYFDKAKNARAGVEEKLGHQEEVHERWEIMRELLDRVTDLQTYEQFAEFTTVHHDELKRLGYKGLAGEKGREREEAPFRTFIVTGGFQVWVGKNSENNDLLTMKYAKPADLWFHARGSSGSHVVLRTGTGKGEPSRRALEEAACIAAFYSKMKTAKHVPVAMTERKYVRKPRGAPAGTVSIEREKLLFVNPKLPEAAKQETKESAP
jgi:predicted ribosome quality control (RQC) complex YloA/Tae2 family protein